MSSPGRLVLAATPIGDPTDASPRLRAVLAAADLVAAEDTRRLRRLAAALGVALQGRVVSYFEGNETSRTPELLAALTGGAQLVLVTDAGTPTVSDPGYRLVLAAVEAGVPVSTVPGPSAVVAALAVSALPADRWCFEGFLPRRPGARRRRLSELAAERRTLVFFEAPHRLAAALADLAALFGSHRPAAVCRELTKTWEEVRRGSLGEHAAWAAGGVRGEVTLVVGGAPEPPTAEPPAAGVLAAMVVAEERKGVGRRSAMTTVAGRLGLPRRVVYDSVVAARHADQPDGTAP